jgi:Flp pilus assembly protein TadG
MDPMRFLADTSVARAARRAARDASGATVVVFALCLLPVIGLLGLGVDYMQGLSYKRRLDAAADSASLAAIAGAQAFYTANQSTLSDPALSSGAVAAGQAQGARAFAANAGSVGKAFTVTPKVVVTPPGQTDAATGQVNGLRQFSAATTFSGAMPTNFGKLFGTRTLSLGGTSGASVTLGSYLDFYLALDVSGSMGLPTSTPDQEKLAKDNTDNLDPSFNYPNGCVFACHFPGWKGYDIAKKDGVKLRVGSVASAVTSLIATAKNTATLPNQFRIGIYPFIVNVMQAAAISTDFTAAQAVANSLGDTYLDTGASNPATRAMGSGGTHFENLLPPFQTYITRIGNGSTSQAPKPFLFIITDGIDNDQTYDGTNWSSDGSQPREPSNINVSYCQYAQSHGVTVAILYIPYLPIEYPMVWEDFETNRIISAIPANPPIPDALVKCASPGFAFKANSDDDINKALQAMFAQALQAARLTH